MELPDTSAVITAFAVDAINVQITFNRHSEAEIQAAKTLLAAAARAGIQPELLKPLLPRLLRLEHFELSLQAALSVTQDQAFSIRVLPLNAGFYRRTNARTDRQNRIQLSVQQVPTSKEQLNG
jgi:hypothetical protein